MCNYLYPTQITFDTHTRTQRLAVHRKQREEAASKKVEAANPFENPMGGADASGGASRTGWLITGGQKSEFDNIFEGLSGAANGKVSGAVVAPELRRQAPSLGMVGNYHQHCSHMRIYIPQWSAHLVNHVCSKATIRSDDTSIHSSAPAA